MKSMFEKCIENILTRNTRNVDRINTLSVSLKENSMVETVADLKKLRSIKDELRAEYKKCMEELDELTDICGIYEVEIGNFTFFAKGEKDELQH